MLYLLSLIISIPVTWLILGVGWAISLRFGHRLAFRETLKDTWLLTIIIYVVVFFATLAVLRNITTA